MVFENLLQRYKNAINEELSNSVIGVVKVHIGNVNGSILIDIFSVNGIVWHTEIENAYTYVNSRLIPKMIAEKVLNDYKRYINSLFFK